jgi:hypothetical protein
MFLPETVTNSPRVIRTRKRFAAKLDERRAQMACARSIVHRVPLGQAGFRALWRRRLATR